VITNRLISLREPHVSTLPFPRVEKKPVSLPSVAIAVLRPVVSSEEQNDWES
jgi:hypothetical protein